MCGFLLSSSSSYWPGFHENRCLLNGCEIILHRSGSLGSDILMPKNPEKNLAPGIHRRFSGQEAKLQSWLGTKTPPSPPVHTRKKTLRYAVICSGKLFNFFLSSLKHGFKRPLIFWGLKNCKPCLQTVAISQYALSNPC